MASASIIIPGPYSINELIAPLSPSWRSLCVMTGAKLVEWNGQENRLVFSVPRGYCSNKAQKIEIFINGLDLYCVNFYSRSGKLVDKIEDCYVDQLLSVFREHTALATRW